MPNNMDNVPLSAPSATGLLAPDERETDPRVRQEVGDYRVVFPDGTRKGGRFFVNKSPAVIEKRGKDATGKEKWDRVTSYGKPSETKTIDSRQSSNPIIDNEVDYALYWLLAGPGAE